MAEILCVQSIHETGMNMLRQEFVLKVASDPSDETVAREGQKAEAIVVRLTKVSAALMDALPNLKIIGRHGIGVDNVDVEAATKRGIVVINVPGEMARAVAEHVMAMLLCLQKKVLVSDACIRSGRYGERDSLRGGEMLGKTLAVVGLGRIGRLVARMAHAGFDMRVIGYDPMLPAGAKVDGVELKGSLAELLKEADMVSLCIPLTNETANLFNTATFAQMKKGSLIINVSRGGIINEDDLVEALKSGQIGGAGLDVFASEPPDSAHPLFGMPNLVVTPHNAGMTAESVVRMSTTLARDVLRALKGERPENFVNPEIWGKSIQRGGNL